MVDQTSLCMDDWWIMFDYLEGSISLFMDNDGCWWMMHIIIIYNVSMPRWIIDTWNDPKRIFSWKTQCEIACPYPFSLFIFIPQGSDSSSFPGGSGSPQGVGRTKHHGGERFVARASEQQRSFPVSRDRAIGVSGSGWPEMAGTGGVPMVSNGFPMGSKGFQWFRFPEKLGYP